MALWEISLQQGVEKLPEIPETHKDLLEGPVVVCFTTIMPDGMPQTTPVWCTYNGSRLYINTAAGRRKHKNIEANPKVNVLALDPSNTNRYVEIRGEVEEIIEDEGDVHLNEVTRLYTGKESYFGDIVPEEDRTPRVRFKIKPIKVVTYG